MRTWQINDVAGNLLHEGRAKTKRGFVQSLVASGLSLERADLNGLDLSNLDLQGANLADADLSRCDLRGAQLQGAVLRQANMSEVRAQGARFERARCEGSDCREADFSGARLTYANFRSAVLDKAVFNSVSASSSVFSRVRADSTDFTDATLTNADFGNSRLLGCDFSGAKLDHRMFGGEDAANVASLCAHLPDRTRGAVVVGCTYDDQTVLADTVPAMCSDRRVSRLTKFGMWAAATMGVVAGGGYVEDLVSTTVLASQLGTGVGFVFVLGAVYLLKEGLNSVSHEALMKAQNSVVSQVRETFKKFKNAATWRKNLVVALARNWDAEPLRQALASSAPDARKRGFWQSFKSFWTEAGQAILCDRRHLALALAALSANRNRKYGLPNDVVLVRCDRDDATVSGSPCAVRFLKSGKTTAVWGLPGGGYATTSYANDGSLEGCWDADGAPAEPSALGLPAAHAERLSVAYTFEAALLKDHGLDWFSYPRDTHYIQAGRTGSIMVHRGTDRRLDNPHDAPALLAVDGSGVRVRNGKVGEEVGPAPGPRP